MLSTLQSGGATSSEYDAAAATAFTADGGSGSAIETIQLRDLLVSSILAACSLTDGDGPQLYYGKRLALYLPNDLRAAIWIEGAKRIGVPFVAVASGTASPSLASRLSDTGASVLVTSDALMAAAEAAMRLMEQVRGSAKQAHPSLPTSPTHTSPSPSLHPHQPPPIGMLLPNT